MTGPALSHQGPRSALTDLSNLPEPDVIARAKGGDSDAFSELYRRNVQRVRSYIYRRVPRAADDLTQETFLRALLALPRYTWTGRPLAAWLCAIALNVVRDHIARVARSDYPNGDWVDKALEGAAADAGTDPALIVPAQLDRSAAAATVKKLLAGLPQDQAQVIRLRFLDDRSVEETAAEIDKGIHATKALQHRGMRRIAAALGVDHRGRKFVKL